MDIKYRKVVINIYIIERITYKDDTERRDNIYSARKGCIGKLYDIIVGQVLWFEYIYNNERNDKKGYLKTSVVESFVEDSDKIIVETLNSVYYFKKLLSRNPLSL